MFISKEQLQYLGHLISMQMVETDQTKIECMTQWPIPNSLKSLRGCFELTSYYRIFIKDYCKISRPLTYLLKNDSFFFE